MIMNVLNYKILEHPVKVYLRRMAFGAAAGFTCRKCLDAYQKEKGLVVTHMKYSAAGGLAGGVRGIVLGLWEGGMAVPYFFSQAMAASLFTFGFFSVRSGIKNMELKYPTTEKPINDLVISSLSGGVAASGVVVTLNGLKARPMMTAFSVGIVLGAVGYFFLEKANEVRLEIILRKEYPEMMKNLQKAEDYINEKQIEDPDYDGPTLPMPWSEYARKALPDMTKFKERMLEREVEHASK